MTYVTDNNPLARQHLVLGRKPGTMSTIQDVRVAEKKVQELLEALNKTAAPDQGNLNDELRTASEEYAKALRELQIESDPRRLGSWQ